MTVIQIFHSPVFISSPPHFHSTPSLNSKVKDSSGMPALQIWGYNMSDGKKSSPGETSLRNCVEVSFSGLFANEGNPGGISRLVLPIFQRRYQWHPEHVSKLVSDVRYACNNRDQNYFAGNIVLVESPIIGDYYIIDGQQRMTTVVMTIAACRYYDPNNKQTYTNWLTRAQLQGITSPYRLWPDIGDTKTGNNPMEFMHYILEPEGIGRLLGVEHEKCSRYVTRLRKNVACILQLLEEIGNGNTLGFAKYLCNRCKFFSIIATDIQAAYKVFCSINIPSGLPLVTMDYYRALLYQRLRQARGFHLSDRKSHTSLREWNDIEARLGGPDITQQFLMHFACVQIYSHHLNTAERIDSIYNLFDSGHESKHKPMLKMLLQQYFDRTEAHAITPELRRYSLLYKKIVKTAQYLEVATKRNFPLQCLRYMSKQTKKWDLWITIALKAAATVSVENSPQFWSKLERLFAFWVVSKTQGQDLVTACDQKIQNLHSLPLSTFGSTYNWNVFDLSDKQVSKFRKQIQGNIYLKHPFGVRYLLLNLEQQNGGIPDLLITLATGKYYATVEHIYPQNPHARSNWESWSSKDGKKWLHKLGNLALLERRINSEARNHGWQVKKVLYRETRDIKGDVTPFMYTRNLCEHIDWTPTLCQARQDKFEQMLFQNYDLGDMIRNPGAPYGEPDDIESVENDIEDDQDTETNDELDLDHDYEVMDDTAVIIDEVNQAESIEFCEKIIARVPESYKDLRCDSTRTELEKYCGRCHSWDANSNKQCLRERIRNSPYCMDHIKKKDNGHSTVETGNLITKKTFTLRRRKNVNWTVKTERSKNMAVLDNLPNFTSCFTNVIFFLYHFLFFLSFLFSIFPFYSYLTSH